MKAEKEKNMNQKPVELTEAELENATGGQMPVNHNLAAHDALNNVNKHAEAIAKATERISTGVEINQTINPISREIEKHIEDLKQRMEEENNQ